MVSGESKDSGEGKRAEVADEQRCGTGQGKVTDPLCSPPPQERWSPVLSVAPVKEYWNREERSSEQ